VRGQFWGSGREAAIRRNRTCQKCSSPHGEGLHRLVGFGAADVKARTRLPFMLEKDSIRLIHGLFESRRRFPRRGRPGTLGSRQPRKHSLEASSAKELPGLNLKTEISVGRWSLCCALSQLPSRYPSNRPERFCGLGWSSGAGRPDCTPVRTTPNDIGDPSAEGRRRRVRFLRRPAPPPAGKAARPSSAREVRSAAEGLPGPVLHEIIHPIRRALATGPRRRGPLAQGTVRAGLPGGLPHGRHRRRT
jgi:hypothetical protein